MLDIKKYALDNNVPIMQDAGIEFMLKYIKDNNIKTILEIGSAIGYSSINFALCGCDVVTVEINTDTYNIAKKNIQDNKLEDKITIYNMDGLLFQTDMKFDLIFIDAAKSQYTKFFELFKDNLTNNGVIISDNLSFHGMVENPNLTNNRNTKQLVGKIRKYINFLKDNNEFDTTFFDIGDGVSISKRKN